jgi:hypothetical protein
MSDRDHDVSSETDITVTEMPGNAESSMKTTIGGISIDFNPLRQNASPSMQSSRESVSKATDSSDAQSQKLDAPKIATDDGIKMDFNPLPQNANAPIRSSRESCPNVTDSRVLQSRKEEGPKITIDEGITIERQSPK